MYGFHEDAERVMARDKIARAEAERKKHAAEIAGIVRDAATNARSNKAALGAGPGPRQLPAGHVCSPQCGHRFHYVNAQRF